MQRFTKGRNMMIFVEMEEFEFRDICISCRKVDHVHNEAGLCMSCFVFAIEASSRERDKKATN